ncbi:kinesin-like protein KIF6 isoform X1 [Clupea harengus]|uniref:Kinesin-like protein KIF6 isoform X1 n=1 Tax=Clupea harengus TaxID=7950 RepID=A0A6P8GFI2_CLUHA|nr:kinesin-like protein KIF6 isoform X1 [Clupea harengus]
MKRVRPSCSHSTQTQNVPTSLVPEFSVGRQEAFEIFRRDHDNQLIIEENKSLLKQRYSEAKTLGEKVNNVRSKINELKRQLELRRRQTAVQGLTTGSPVPENPGPVEERLLSEIEEEKKNYKSIFGRLKGLKTEIEHLQLLLERAKVKLQMDFHEWWKQEANKPQHPILEVTSAATRPPTSVSSPPAIRDIHMMGLDAAVMSKKDTDSNNPPVSGDLRALSSSSLSDSSIPLTGDTETDEDILAFIRARQNLLNSTGPLKTKKQA